ncbi:DNA repair photolyase [Tenacibaculum sp. MAR_2009_124]|uniref:PA0069 family radical SAM protein n=1 Tax=Tenacibaculum sp. MAR_2009_124 TaxID=1250059 RepID=UPI00089CFA45|nr:PA0069 family radical SAM protein [Tenacibaculum sp. MAR_2009_124]SEB35563.1 DNA repair photolyase [Tenacibaculum sp. MAR_2009_124]
MEYIKGRGAQTNTQNKFLKNEHNLLDEFLNYCEIQNEKVEQSSTSYLEVFPKTILNKVTSPDIGFVYSMNPYQGCEHGCIYCYARNSHEYWGYSAGLDFEKKILYKSNAAQLLKKKLQSRSWQPENIMLSGNTDCYQPIERKLKITKAMLEVILEHKHPVSIITKNALILRDLDLLKELASLNLLKISISITSLSEKTRTFLEPRTATIKRRFEVVKILSDNGIPVNVMIAPIIPSINSHELLPLAKKASESGANSIGYTTIRLNGAIGEIFRDWLNKTYPDRANKVVNQIKEIHEGTLNESRYGIRMRGVGQIAEQIKQQFLLAKKLYFKHERRIDFDLSLFDKNPSSQMKLF